MKTKLVIEGGGVRGIYTAGALDVFMEMGYEKNVLILTLDIEYRKSPELSFLP